ncbi:nitroreductase family protein [Paenibacillus arenilitoris]|uniref:Putative NAD(P)H nitroreductase n=1 Tax=Paenibacillus arenilitoris TaxID=2772299 RepID=A0A927CLZ8_9BACL|nr:nitroreductase [Paenibacillus arenilitoris]MBD2870553.1 nitroreductase [Paenibacillus arenilitoris]
MNTESVKRLGTMSQLIKERRTVRLFTGDPVTVEQLTELLDVAVWAPNHNLREPWRFIVYTGEGRKVFADAVFQSFTQEEAKKYGEARRNEYMATPLHLIVALKEDPRQKQWDEDFSAVSCLIQNLQLAAWEQGIGMVWKSNPYMYHPKFREAAGIQPGEKVVAVLHIGYPRIIPPAAPRTPAIEKLTVVDR